MTKEEFLEYTKSIWTFSAESARKIGHPAPFAGSGTTCIAALKAGRHYIGYDTEKNYVRLAERRVRQYKGDLAKHQLELIKR